MGALRKSSPAHPKGSQWGCRPGLSGGHHLEMMQSEQLFHYLSLTNPATVIWEYVCAIREEKEKKPHSVYSGRQLSSFLGPIMLLNLDVTLCSNRKTQHCPHRLIR